MRVLQQRLGDGRAAAELRAVIALAGDAANVHHHVKGAVGLAAA